MPNSTQDGTETKQMTANFIQLIYRQENLRLIQCYVCHDEF